MIFMVCTICGGKQIMSMVYCLLLLPLLGEFSLRSLFYFFFAVHCALSSFAIIWAGKRELVALLLLCSVIVL